MSASIYVIIRSSYVPYIVCSFDRDNSDAFEFYHQKVLPVKTFLLIGASLSKPHSNLESGAVVHAQRTTAK